MYKLGFIIYWQNLAVYFDSFRNEGIPQEILNKIKDKSITHNIFRIQDNESKNVWILLCHFHRIYACRKKILILYYIVFSNWLWKEWIINILLLKNVIS